jgi:amino acid transporter
MQEATPTTSAITDDDDARLASLGYNPQLNRVLGLFSNFSVAFTYLSPIVGVFSLFTFGAGMGGPAYVWTTWIPVAGMLLVALVFGELASHYPVAGALYQYSKYNVGRRYGWFVGWFYGIALLVTVASVDTGVVSYFAALMHNWFNWNLNPASHWTILIITLVLLVIQTTLNIAGTSVMGLVARFGVYVEILGTVGLAIVLAIHGFHHGLGYLFSTQGVQHVKTNPLGLDFGGSYFGALLIAVLAPVYIFYGFESAGDISEETKDAGRQVPRAMRHALIWGGVASFIVIAALLLSIPAKGGFAGAIGSTLGAVPYILSQLPSAIQDIALLLLIFAFFSCGSSIQGAGSRLMFSYARDGALPAAKWISTVHSRFKTPVNALLSGAVVTALFVLLEFASPSHDVHILWFTYPANVNVLVSLISFGTSGIYLSFFLTVVAPTGLTSPRGYFNLDWITLVVMIIVFIVGAVLFALARGGKEIDAHLRDDAEKPAAVK